MGINVQANINVYQSFSHYSQNRTQAKKTGSSPSNRRLRVFEFKRARGKTCNYFALRTLWSLYCRFWLCLHALPHWPNRFSLASIWGPLCQRPSRYNTPTLSIWASCRRFKGLLSNASAKKIMPTCVFPSFGAVTLADWHTYRKSSFIVS